jgi:GT2 family glycosyltransferase/glycosyltransferase involved in cell wall biosynthesis
MEPDPPAAPLVYVSIVGRNSIQWLADCLDSVLASDYPNFRVVYLDNDSEDGTAELAATQYPQVQLIRLDRNVGFGRGHNRVTDLALRQGADFVTILNVDTTVEPAWLTELVAAGLADRGVAVWMPLQYDYSGEQLDENFLRTARRNPRFAADQAAGKLARTYDVPTAIGAAALFPRSSLSGLGGFDPHYFAYCEESDWCHRAFVAGLRVGLATRAGIRHWHTRLHPDESYAVKPEVQAFHHLKSQFVLFLKNPYRSFGRNAYGYFRSGLKTIVARNGSLRDSVYARRLLKAQAWVACHLSGIARRHRVDRQRARLLSGNSAQTTAVHVTPPGHPKLAILNSSLGIVNRGAEQVLLFLGRYLAGRHTVAHYAGGSPLPEGCERISNLNRNHPLAGWLPRMPFARRLNAQPIDLERLTFAVSALPRLMTGRFDCVITSANFWSSAIAALNRRLRGTPFVGRSGGWMMSGVEGLRFRPDVYVVVNPQVEESLKSRYPNQDIRCIPNAVDLDRFSPGTSNLDLNLPRPVFLCATALEPRKRVDLAIEAVSRLSTGSLLVVGRGPEAQGLREMGLRILGPDRFHLTSAVPEDMPQYYRLCDVFTLPSLNEPFGLVYLEAMACNRPVVAQRDRVRSYIVGSAGLLIDCEDLTAYSAALEEASRGGLGDRPREQAKQFSWERTGPMYLDAIREAIRLGHRRRQAH